ncbi:hypothetical protein ACOYW6_09010 [Parablastomonas sp. CN1-191]|uniref:hypothetical protein n=1 Tax=Parablastomonas sp. CN1-191 TaxID=3400908 RepID=UPI003BF91BAC
MFGTFSGRRRAGAKETGARVLDIAQLPEPAAREAPLSGPLLASRLGAALSASEAPHRAEAATIAALRRALDRLSER